MNVRVARWVRGIQAILLKEVLQVWMGKSWCPTPDGAMVVHVPGGGQFRVWIAPDKRYSQQELQQLCDEKRLGTLVLLINNHEREFAL